MNKIYDPPFIKYKKPRNYKNDYIYFASGAIAGLIGEYVANVIANIITDDRDYLAIRSELSGYIAAIVSGAIATYIGIKDKLGLIQSVIFGVGLYYAIFYASSDALGVDYNFDNLNKYFLLDVFIVYGIIWIQEDFIDEFRKALKITKKGREEEIEFNQALFETLISGVIISLYFGVKTSAISKQVI